MSASVTEVSVDPCTVEEWRCACTWVGGDPDERIVRGRLKVTCPACWHHDRRRLVVKTRCPGCGAWEVFTTASGVLRCGSCSAASKVPAEYLEMIRDNALFGGAA